MIIEQIRAILNFGIKKNLLDKNVVYGVDLLKIDNHRERYLKKHEVNKLLEYMNEHYEDRPQFILFVKILLETGTRVSSCINIKYGDIDFQSNKLKLRDFKNTSIYYTILPSKTVKFIQTHFSNLEDDANIFTYHQNTFARHLRKVLDELFNKKLKTATRKNRAVVHTLRHTFATTVLNNGAEINTVRHLLNHRSTSTTLRYGKMADETIKSVVNDKMYE